MYSAPNKEYINICFYKTIVSSVFK